MISNSAYVLQSPLCLADGQIEYLTQQEGLLKSIPQK